MSNESELSSRIAGALTSLKRGSVRLEKIVEAVNPVLIDDGSFIFALVPTGESLPDGTGVTKLALLNTNLNSIANLDPATLIGNDLAMWHGYIGTHNFIRDEHGTTVGFTCGDVEIDGETLRTKENGDEITLTKDVVAALARGIVTTIEVSY